MSKNDEVALTLVSSTEAIVYSEALALNEFEMQGKIAKGMGREISARADVLLAAMLSGKLIEPSEDGLTNIIRDLRDDERAEVHAKSEEYINEMNAFNNPDDVLFIGGK